MHLIAQPIATAAAMARACAGHALGEVVVGEGGDFYAEVDAVEQGVGDAGAVATDLSRRAGAGAPRVGEIAAGAGIHRGEEGEARRVGQRDLGTGDGDGVVFQALAQRVLVDLSAAAAAQRRQHSRPRHGASSRAP